MERRKPLRQLELTREACKKEWRDAASTKRRKMLGDSPMRPAHSYGMVKKSPTAIGCLLKDRGHPCPFHVISTWKMKELKYCNDTAWIEKQKPFSSWVEYSAILWVAALFLLEPLFLFRGFLKERNRKTGIVRICSTVCFHGILCLRHVLRGHSRHDAAVTYPSAFIRDSLNNTWFNRGGII